MNKFDKIVKEFSDPDTPGNEKRIKKIIKDMNDKEFEELKLQFEKAVADHIYPVSKGGLSTLQNMVLICNNCNEKKSDLTLRIFCKQQNYNYN